MPKTDNYCLTNRFLYMCGIIIDNVDMIHYPMYRICNNLHFFLTKVFYQIIINLSLRISNYDKEITYTDKNSMVKKQIFMFMNK